MLWKSSAVQDSLSERSWQGCWSEAGPQEWQGLRLGDKPLLPALLNICAGCADLRRSLSPAPCCLEAS